MLNIFRISSYYQDSAAPLIRNPAVFAKVSVGCLGRESSSVLTQRGRTSSGGSSGGSAGFGPLGLIAGPPPSPARDAPGRASDTFEAAAGRFFSGPSEPLCHALAPIAAPKRRSKKVHSLTVKIAAPQAAGCLRHQPPIKKRGLSCCPIQRADIRLDHLLRDEHL